MMKIKKVNRMSLNKKMRLITLRILTPLILCIIVIMIILGTYAMRYSKITHNVNVSSRFNIEFKENLDMKMYHYAVSNKGKEDLPIEDVEVAIAIARSLSETTECKESRQSIRNVLDYCENLKKRMYALGETDGYDSRIQQLDNNIYVLTGLIQEKMMDYIYYEAGYLTMIEDIMNRGLVWIFVILVLVIMVVSIIILYRSFRFSDGIARPISALRENVKKVGNGMFNIPVVESNDYEIADLNMGIQNMAKRIEKLLQDVKEEEQLQHKMQLQLLQAQVSPHFLYNTLDTIIWLVEADKQADAIAMLGNLSVFFRTALSEGNDIIRLEEEMMHTRSYLDIQQVRYRDILHYSIDLPDSVFDIMIPKLTLQPITENALYHGVKEKRGRSLIRVTAHDRGSDVLIVVEDSGIGMKPEKLAEVRKALNGGTRIGFGMAAVQERIRLCYGTDYGISVSSVYGEGTRVEILIGKNQPNG
ncbi:MAG: sensor histidine kinase [Clostridia bacterium]|nr:sensor histidine kinase [Clostridia bacterium]